MEIEEKIEFIYKHIQAISVSKEFMRIKEASEFTGFAVQTLYQLVHAREIPFIRKKGTIIFFRDDLKEWLLKDRKETKSEINYRLSKTTF